MQRVNAEPILYDTLAAASSIRERATSDETWTWTSAAPSPTLGNVRYADWDDEGSCLVATTRGLFFWDGADWRAIEHAFDPLSIRFVRFVGLGRWLVGAKDVWFYAFGELSLLWTHPKLVYEHFDGSFDAALAASRGPRGPILRAYDGQWHDAFALRDLSLVASLSRVDHDKWLVTGETTAGESFAALVEPFARRTRRLQSSTVRTFVASAGLPKLGVGCAIGLGGALLCDRVATAVETISHPTAVAIDPSGRVAVASAGRIWLRRGAPEPSWDLVWEDASMRRPIMALAAGARRIRALANDAAIVEGWWGSSPAPRSQAPSLPDIFDDDDDEVTRASPRKEVAPMKL